MNEGLPLAVERPSGDTLSRFDDAGEALVEVPAQRVDLGNEFHAASGGGHRTAIQSLSNHPREPHPVVHFDRPNAASPPYKGTSRGLIVSSPQRSLRPAIRTG